MPPRRGRGGANQQQQHMQQDGAPLERIVKNESLRATENEREATSASLYSDHKARISSNLSDVRDRARNQAFSCAFNNSFPGKTVLVMGCGMGLHCMMAARAGAKTVVGVDISSIVHTGAEIAKRNNLNNIHFVQGRFTPDTSKSGDDSNKTSADGKKEHVPVKLPIDKFDVVFYEWMGSFITNDDDFLELEYAVKNHLLPGGTICPNRAQLHAVALSDFNYRAEMLDYWDNVYGFSMAPMRPLVQHEATSGHIPRDCVATKPAPVHALDLGNADVLQKLAQLRSWSSPFKLVVEKKCTLHFITFYLSAAFTDKNQPRGNFLLPFSMGEHNSFTEVSLTLPTPIPVFANDELTGTLQVNPIRNQMTELVLTIKCNNAAVPDFNMSEKYVFQY